jgi:hypothetical protein
MLSAALQESLLDEAEPYLTNPYYTFFGYGDHGA